MKSNRIEYTNIQSQYPDEWVLIGNPVISNARVLNGEMVYHTTSKREIFEFAKKIIDNYEMIKIVYTGKIPKISQLGIFKVTENE
jgi:hypothetical protein